MIPIVERIRMVKEYSDNKSFEEFIFLILIEILEEEQLIKILERVEKVIE